MQPHGLYMAYTWYYSIPIYGILQARIPSLGDLSNPGIEPRSPALGESQILYELSHQGSRIGHSSLCLKVDSPLSLILVRSVITSNLT